MILRPENATRRVDHLGRITLPKSLRDRMYINSDNDTVELFTLEYEGKMYICLGSPETKANKIHAARAILEELGIDIPKELEQV